jgi:hypothetical protein
VVEVPSSLRGSVDVLVASDRYFDIGLVSRMWKSSLIPLKTWEFHFNKVIIKVKALL